MALTKAAEAITDWTAVIQNGIVESGILDISGHYGTVLHLQAALDTTTAHTGTKFKVQVSSNASGDEDWEDLTEFIALIGTAATDLIENDPLNAAETSLTLTAHALTVEGIWILIEDGTLANSELIFVASQTANAVVALDGVTNAHALNTAVFDIAISRAIEIPWGSGLRARLIVDNSYDDNGSSLNYKLRATKVTGI